MSETPDLRPRGADAHLEALGYSGTDFHRSMSLWSNMALGFTYLSPLVGVYSLFAYSLSIGGPPAMWWIVIVGCGQFLVALVFGEVVSQYPIAGGIYPWTRRLWGRKYAWMVSWIYLWAMIVTVTAVAEFGGGFVAALFGVELSNEVDVAHRGRAVGPRAADQLQRHPHAGSDGPDRTRGRARRRHRPGPVPADLQTGAFVLGVLRLHGCRRHHALRRHLPGCGAVGSVPVLRIRGVR